MPYSFGSSMNTSRHNRTAAVSSMALAVVACSTWYSSCQRSTTTTAGSTNGDSSTSPSSSSSSPRFRVEVHLMDKIQQKAYLSSVKDGIPSTLRILAIDLPEMRTRAFSGDCRLAHDKVFVSEVASPKVVPLDHQSHHDTADENFNGNDRKLSSSSSSKTKKITPTQLKIAQKALVKSIVHCRSSQSQQRVGVELLEASVADLNRFDLRKTHQFGNFKYDPGKYYTHNRSRHQPQSEEEEEESNDAMDEEEISEVDDVVLLDKSRFDDEIEAPWNQYAWAEELRLRINGQVGFDAPMEKSNSWNRMIFGQAYKITVPSVYHLWEWPLPTFAKSDPDGVDGRNPTNCRACNKPHAVIANGAALQRVPSSLRLLQKLCRKADVPLFVIHDPRVWGGNTHQTLSEALGDMRATIKNRVIGKALKQQGSTAFARGRMLGQFETETKWQVKEQKRVTRELFGVGNQRRRKADSDWSQLDSIRLEKRLVERGVIKETTVSDGEGSSETHKTYADSLVELAKRCLLDIAEQKKQQQQQGTAQINHEDTDATEATPSDPTATATTPINMQ